MLATSYVEADRRLLDSWHPDLVVGDFRLTLAVSARLARIPYLPISSAHWVPTTRVSLPRPDLAPLRYIGEGPARLLPRRSGPSEIAALVASMLADGRLVNAATRFRRPNRAIDPNATFRAVLDEVAVRPTA